MHIDIDMGYYSMELEKASKDPCVTCLHWILYMYNMLSMVIKVASDAFQSVMSGLFIDLEGVIVYINDIIIIGASTFEEHMSMVNEVLRRLENNRMQVNP